MARKRNKAEEAPVEIVGDDPVAELQRPPAEVLYAQRTAEAERLEIVAALRGDVRAGR